MTTRAATKPGRPAGKTTLKTTGRTHGKGDKQSASGIDIVPGKFNESDWFSLIETDETEDFITDIFDHIWNETSKRIQEIYLRKQLLSFTLMRTEDALSSLVQWAFLERDEPKPQNDNFWMGDDEPIPCAMDNWGEGVVPACREQRPEDIEKSSILSSEGSPSAPITPQTAEDLDQSQRPMTSSTHSDRQSKYSPETDFTRQPNEITQSIEIDMNTPIFTRKEFITERQNRRLSFEQKLSHHDLLVIDTDPPKLEPIGDLFQRTSTTITPKRRRMILPKMSSQFGSETIRSATNMTETTSTVTKSVKRAESKLFDDQYIEKIISKAPVAAHSMLKSILSRPPGYRELELNEEGNVVSLVKLDPDKFGQRSIHVSCDIVKPRKSLLEIRPPPKPPRKMNLSRSEPKFSPIKLVLPEQSTEVGDLIQTMPGVIYEDSKLRKGDSRRYQTGMARYTNFYDESRPLKPIARTGDLVTLAWTADDVAHTPIAYNQENDNQQDLQISKLHRFNRIPPIMSASSTASST